MIACNPKGINYASNKKNLKENLIVGDQRLVWRTPELSVFYCLYIPDFAQFIA